MIASDHEVSLTKEGKLPHYPLASLVLLELAPVVRIEEPVVVGHMEVLTDQSEYLCLCPEGVVAYNDGSDAVLDLHFGLSKQRTINFIKFLTSFVDKSYK